MIDWAQRTTKFLQSATTPTAKTDETIISSALSAPSQGVCEKSMGDSSVSSVGSPGVSEESQTAEDVPLSHCWRLIEGDEIRDLTVAPSATKTEIQRQYPGAVVALGFGPKPDAESLAVIQAIGPLVGERDLDVLAGQANTEGVDWVWDCGMAELTHDPVAVISSLSEAESILAADALLARIPLPEALSRAVSPLVPAMRGRFGAQVHRAQHARTILFLIAADPTVRSDYTASGRAP